MKIKIPMTFKDGDNGRKMLPQFKNKSTNFHFIQKFRDGFKAVRDVF